MNALVNYASDSDSENEDPHVTHQQQQRQQGQQDDGPGPMEDDFLLSALKDLQSFADSVDDAPSAGSSGPGDRPDIDEDGFQSFLKEIDAIPCPPEDRDQPARPPPPPPPPSESLETGVLPPPPPPPPPPETSLTANIDNIQEATLHHVKSIHSRLHHISLLPSASIDQKDLERRLLEFAIRIVDWEKGGLYEAYFLGKELAEAIVAFQQHGGTVSSDSIELPSFGGIVGSMIKHLHHLEHMAAPLGWSAIWDAEDEAYGFQHSKTGTYSPIYPSQELIHYLDPPSRTPGSGPPALSIQSRSHFGSRTISSPKDISSPTFVQGSWSQTTPSLQSPTSIIASPINTSQPPTNVPKTTTSKLKKRKAEENATDRASEESVFQDQHIHPSRRAVLTSKPGAVTSTSTTSTLGSSSSSSSSSSKVMPRKLASLLQKWSEKDKEESDEDEDEQEHEYQTGGRQDSNASSVPMTGANSQSLGSDWRDRRLRPK